MSIQVRSCTVHARFGCQPMLFEDSAQFAELMVFERQVKATIHFWSFPEGSTCHKNMFELFGRHPWLMMMARASEAGEGCATRHQLAWRLARSQPLINVHMWIDIHPCGWRLNDRLWRPPSSRLAPGDRYGVCCWSVAFLEDFCPYFLHHSKMADRSTQGRKERMFTLQQVMARRASTSSERVQTVTLYAWSGREQWRRVVLASFDTSKLWRGALTFGRRLNATANSQQNVMSCRCPLALERRASQLLLLVLENILCWVQKARELWRTLSVANSPTLCCTPARETPFGVSLCVFFRKTERRTTRSESATCPQRHTYVIYLVDS